MKKYDFLREDYVELKYINGAVYGIPTRVIADDRAKYYAKNDPSATYQEEFEYAMKDDYEALDWLGNNMNMMDLEEHFFEIAPPAPFNPIDEEPISFLLKKGKNT